MKARNLFLSLCAFAAICSCSKEIEPGVKDSEVLAEDTFIKINIAAPSVASKGTDGGTEAGTAAEHAVKNVMLAFFASNGEFIETKEYSDFTWTESSNSNVEYISSINVVLQGKTIVPRQVVAILNYTPALKTAVSGVASRSALYNLVSENPVSEIDGDKYFVMTNSAYLEGGAAVYYSQIADSHMYTGDEAPVDYKPLDVYVERVAAKVSVESNATAAIKTITLHSGTDLHYYPAITGVCLTSTADKSFLLKHIHDYSSVAGWTWLFIRWNDPTNYRSYWATTNTDSFTKVSYEQIGVETDWTRYYNENTSHANHTQLLVAATIKQAADAVTMSPSDPSIGDFVKFGPTYYTADDFLTSVANEIAALGVKVGGANITKEHLAIKYTTGYYSKVTLADALVLDDESKRSAANAKLEDYEDILFWKDGKAYFFTHVEHFGPDAGVNAFGMVRNHHYDIAINSITGLGTPVNNEYVEITPEKPTDLDYNLAAKINILTWKVVRQTVDLN